MLVAAAEARRVAHKPDGVRVLPARPDIAGGEARADPRVAARVDSHAAHQVPFSFWSLANTSPMPPTGSTLHSSPLGLYHGESLSSASDTVDTAPATGHNYTIMCFGIGFGLLKVTESIVLEIPYIA